MSNTPDLLPCPFCGSMEITGFSQGTGLRFHECDRCKSIGPMEHPNADPPQGWNVRALKSKPTPAPVQGEGWSDLKIAFTVLDEEPIWDVPASTWPNGWELCETDAAGCRVVAVFRVAHLPNPIETRAVRRALAAMAGR